MQQHPCTVTIHLLIVHRAGFRVILASPSMNYGALHREKTHFDVTCLVTVYGSISFCFSQSDQRAGQPVELSVQLLNNFTRQTASLTQPSIPIEECTVVYIRQCSGPEGATTLSSLYCGYPLTNNSAFLQYVRQSMIHFGVTNMEDIIPARSPCCHDNTSS